jgi:hypothetical protein
MKNANFLPKLQAKVFLKSSHWSPDAVKQTQLFRLDSTDLLGYSSQTSVGEMMAAWGPIR